MPRHARAVLSLVITRRDLRRFGFAETYERYAQLSCDLPLTELAVALRAFKSSENLFVSKAAPNDCLLRSLALFQFLRLENIAVEHVIGVMRSPFGAHAWVQYRGEPLFDNQAKRFTVLARMGSEIS
jgi:hypothetical protein